MDKIVKGCLVIFGIIAGFILLVVGVKFILGENFMYMFLLMGMFGFMFLIIALSESKEVIIEVIKTGKWLGLGSIAGNVLNNKTNAEASSKAGWLFKKKSLQTGISMVDKVAEFVSPEMEAEDVTSQLTENEYREFQAFLKWKEEQAKEVE